MIRLFVIWVRVVQGVINIPRLIPHIVFWKACRRRAIIDADVCAWQRALRFHNSQMFGFIRLMGEFPEFRNLYYKRVGVVGKLIEWLAPRMSTLFIYTDADKIGPGLFIQHGFATVIAAREIGRGCWINQQVTIGYSSKNDCPIIGDRVTICAGAKVIGKVVVGDDSVIGANAVVVKDVPPLCTVVGVPAYVIKEAGIRVRHAL